MQHFLVTDGDPDKLSIIWTCASVSADENDEEHDEHQVEDDEDDDEEEEEEEDEEMGYNFLDVEAAASDVSAYFDMDGTTVASLTPTSSSATAAPVLDQQLVPRKTKKLKKTSRFHGVEKNKRSNTWISSIVVHDTKIVLGEVRLALHPYSFHLLHPPPSPSRVRFSSSDSDHDGVFFHTVHLRIESGASV